MCNLCYLSCCHISSSIDYLLFHWPIYRQKTGTVDYIIMHVNNKPLTFRKAFAIKPAKSVVMEELNHKQR